MVEHVLDSLRADGKLSVEQLAAFVSVQVDRVGGRLLLDTPLEHLAAVSRWQRMEDLAFVGMMRAVTAASDATSGSTPVPEQLQDRLDKQPHTPGVRTMDFLFDEIGLAIGASPRTGGDLVGTAWQAVQLPGLLEAVEQGLLTRRHALAALQVMPGNVEDSVPLEVQTAVLLVALGRFHGHTPAQFARLLRRLLHLADPTLTAKREQKKTAERGVSFREVGDGQAMVTAVGPSLQVAAIRASLEAALREHEASGRDELVEPGCDEVLVDLETGEVLPADPEPAEPGEERDRLERAHRDRDARRFDVFTALLTGGTTAPEHWVVDVLVPYSVTQGGQWELAEVPGLGAVLPQTARDLAALAGATRRVAVRGLDPLTASSMTAGAGQVLDVSDLQGALDSVKTHRLVGDLLGPDVRSLADRNALVAAAAEALAQRPVRLRDLSSIHYVPSGRAIRLLERRDRTCVFPGCHVPAQRTDKDHRVPWPAGPTTVDNLQCLCRRHHRAKQALWLTQQGLDGSVLWTSRVTGHTYARRAQGY